MRGSIRCPSSRGDRGQLDERPPRPTARGPSLIAARLSSSSRRAPSWSPRARARLAEVAECGPVAPHVAAAAEGGRAVVQQRLRPGEVALRHGEVAEVALGEPGAARVADPAPDREALLEQLARLRELAHGSGEVAQPPERVRDRPLVADGAEQRGGSRRCRGPRRRGRRTAGASCPGWRARSRQRSGSHVLEWREGLLERHAHGARVRLGDDDLAEIHHRRRGVRRARRGAEDHRGSRRSAPRRRVWSPGTSASPQARGAPPPCPGPNPASVAILRPAGRRPLRPADRPPTRPPRRAPGAPGTLPGCRRVPVDLRTPLPHAERPRRAHPTGS